MTLQWQTRSNPLAWWWGLLVVVSCLNVAVWFLMYHQFHQPLAETFPGTSRLEPMLLLCAVYVFGCAFRSVLPRADVQRICLVDSWLSSVLVGRSVATVAEICFAAQWAIILTQLGRIADADTTLNASRTIVPLILIAQCCSWYAVLTTDYLGNAIENSIWAAAFLVVGVGLFRLLPEFDGPIRLALVVAIVGILVYLAFLITIDVPMYLNRWKAGLANGKKLLRPLEGLYDAATRWVVTHDFSHWKDEIAWMSLYFSAAVWASLALCVLYSLDAHRPRHQPEGATVTWSSGRMTAMQAAALSDRFFRSTARSEDRAPPTSVAGQLPMIGVVVQPRTTRS